MKKKTIFCFLIIQFLFCSSKNSYAQQDDAALWARITLEKFVAPKLLVHFREAIRVRQNITQLNYAYSDIGLTFKINNNIQTSLNYRFISNLKTQDYLSLRHRLYLTLSLKKKIKPICIITRFIVLSQLEDIYSTEDGEIPSYYLRSKITVKYELKRLSPFLATELYTNISSRKDFYSDRYRLIAGCDYEINKMNELGLFYLIQKRFNQINPLTDYVIGISYTHRFY